MKKESHFFSNLPIQSVGNRPFESVKVGIKSGVYPQLKIHPFQSQRLRFKTSEDPNEACVAACAVSCAAACIFDCFWSPWGTGCTECVDNCMGPCARNC